jgi:hypothetical protein
MRWLRYPSRFQLFPLTVSAGVVSTAVVVAVYSLVAVSTEGTGQSVIGACQDLAGNSATATIGGINIDTHAPTFGCTPAAADVYGTLPIRPLPALAKTACRA